MITKWISHSDLIDLLENYFEDVFENIKEDDGISNIELHGNQVSITIGESDEEEEEVKEQ